MPARGPIPLVPAAPANVLRTDTGRAPSTRRRPFGAPVESTPAAPLAVTPPLDGAPNSVFRRGYETNRCSPRKLIADRRAPPPHKHIPSRGLRIPFFASCCPIRGGRGCPAATAVQSASARLRTHASAGDGRRGWAARRMDQDGPSPPSTIGPASPIATRPGGARFTHAAAASARWTAERVYEALSVAVLNVTARTLFTAA